MSYTDWKIPYSTTIVPQELLDAALLRKNNPEATLKELCKLSEAPLTVSGLNHRLSKIISIYEEISDKK